MRGGFIYPLKVPPKVDDPSISSTLPHKLPHLAVSLTNCNRTTGECHGDARIECAQDGCSWANGEAAEDARHAQQELAT
jgi:hypothetical protein